MARAYGEDLRRRVVAAIEDGMPSRAAARRFAIGESTAGAWHRAWKASGSYSPGRQGNPGGSRLDRHAAFIVGLTEEGGKDITLSEIAERLEAEHGEKVDRSTVWHWLARRGVTVKKRPRTLPNRIAPTSA